MLKKGDIINPTGKGGFADNPQNRANGRWNPETSISYWQNYYIRLESDEFEKCLNDKMTMAQQIAYNNVFKATQDLLHQKELSDRTEGKAKTYSEIDFNGNASISINPKDWV